METGNKEFDVTNTADENRPAEVILASEYARLAAVLIDALAMILAFILVGIVLVLAGLTESRESILNGEGFAAVFAEFAMGISIYLAINGRMLSARGQTVGKRLMKVRIVDMNNKIPPLWKILIVRFLPIQVMATFGTIGSLLIIADSLFIFTQDRRCIHDWLAGTQVVKA